MNKPSFPKLNIICDFCGRSFELPYNKYRQYYEGQISFYCSNECKKSGAAKNRLNRLKIDYVGLSRVQWKELKLKLIKIRANELEQFRIDNADDIKAKMRSLRNTTNKKDYINDPRTLAIVNCFLACETLQCIGDKFGISRERVRQLLLKCGYNKSNAPVRPKKPKVLPEHTCSRCGTVFKGKKRKYCTNECRSAGSISSRNKFTTLKCSGCGCEFTRSDYLLNIAKHSKISRGYDVNVVYCTRKCYAKNGRCFGHRR